MTHAIIKSGGKQYLVSDGVKVKVDKLDVEEGKKIAITDVLLTATDSAISIGTPLVKGAKVEATVVRQGRHAKITGAKVKPKKRYKKIFGHRAHFTELEITKIATK